jgi:hypothetical protein
MVNTHICFMNKFHTCAMNGTPPTHRSLILGVWSRNHVDLKKKKPKKQSMIFLMLQFEIKIHGLLIQLIINSFT